MHAASQTRRAAAAGGRSGQRHVGGACSCRRRGSRPRARCCCRSAPNRRSPNWRARKRPRRSRPKSPRPGSGRAVRPQRRRHRRPADSGDGVLIPVPLLTSLWAGAVTARGVPLRRRQSDGRGPSSTAGWVGLRLGACRPTAAAPAAHTNVQLAHSLASTVVSLYGLLTDPLTGLPGRNELHGALRLDLHRARRRRLPCALRARQSDRARVGQRAARPARRRRRGARGRAGAAVAAAPLRRADALRRCDLRVAARQRRARRGPAGRRTGPQPHRRPRASSTTRCGCAAPWASWRARPPRPRRSTRSICCAAPTKRWPRRGSRAARRVVVWRDDATGADAPATDRLFGIFTGAPTRTTATWGCCGTCCRSSRARAAAPSSPQQVVERLRDAAAVRSASGCSCSDEAGLRLLVGQQRGSDGSRWRWAPATSPRPSGR